MKEASVTSVTKSPVGMCKLEPSFPVSFAIQHAFAMSKMTFLLAMKRWKYWETISASRKGIDRNRIDMFR